MNEQTKKLKNITTTSTILTIFGILSTIWNTLMTVTSLAVVTSGESTDIFADYVVLALCIVWTCAGIFMIVLGAQKRKCVSLYHKYYHICQSNFSGDITVENIATFLHEDIKKVSSDVSVLQKNRLWTYIINSSTRRASTDPNAEKREMLSSISVICNSCSATNTAKLYDYGAKCEFCGSPLGEEIKAQKYKGFGTK